MKKQEKSASTPTRMRQTRRKRRPTTRQRMTRNLGYALRERDPEFAENLSQEFCALHMGPWLTHGDERARMSCHGRYTQLNALHASELFWQWYIDSHDRPMPQFAELGKADLQDIWRARQCADALGMTYDAYVDSVFEAFAVTGRISCPSIKEMSSSFAVLAAAERKAYERELDDMVHGIEECCCRQDELAII